MKRWARYMRRDKGAAMEDFLKHKGLLKEYTVWLEEEED